MKLAGKESFGTPTRKLEVQRGDVKYTLVIAPLPFGFNDFLEGKGITRPIPPQKIARPGGQVIKLADGGLKTESDYEDAGFRDKLRLYEKRITAVTLAEFMREDESFESNAERPKASDDANAWVKYADDMAAEMLDFGFLDDEVNQIFEAGNNIFGSQDATEDNDFLSRTEIEALVAEMMEAAGTNIVS